MKNMRFILKVLFILFVFPFTTQSAYSFELSLSTNRINSILSGENFYIKTGSLNKNIKRITCKIRGKSISFVGKSGTHPSGYTFIFKGIKAGEAIITEKIFKYGKNGESTDIKRFMVRVYNPEDVPIVSLKEIARKPELYANSLVKLIATSRGWGKPVKAQNVWGTMFTRSDWVIEDFSGAAYITGLPPVKKGSRLTIICRVLTTKSGSWTLLGIKKLSVIGEELSTVVNDNNLFAFKLYKELSTDKGNIFFSPFSISDALAMAYAGARGETEKQIATVMQFTLPQSKLHPAFHSLINLLQTSHSSAYQLNIANALWGQKGYGFLKEFKTLINRYYGGGFHTVDFIKHTEEARKKINKWIEEKTKEKIKNLIAKGDISSLTRLVLTNAIYFKGGWAHTFKKKNTKPMPFYLNNQKSVNVPMMFQKGKFPYFEDSSIKLVELPYKGNEISMIVLLPRKNINIAQIEKKLTPEHLKYYLYNSRKIVINLYIPRFKLKRKYYMKKVLSEIGMPIAFSNKANFSGITGKKELKISKVIHQAFIEVNEEGTEAAAATAVVMRLKAVFRHPTFKADHPFIFILLHRKTGSILFIGKVSNPIDKD